MHSCLEDEGANHFMLENIRTFPTSPTGEQITYVLKHLTYARIDKWLDTEFNTPGWWFLIAIAIVSLVIWWKMVDKKLLLELTFYGFTIMTIDIWFDQVGYELGLWYYPVDLIPVFPPSTSIDYVILPVVYTLVYQYFRSWKAFILATLLMANVFSFVLEPLLVKFGFYVLVKWKFYYSFPIYITIGIILKSVVNKMKDIIVRHQEQVVK